MVRKLPGALWISIASLGVITLIQLIIGVQKGSGIVLVAVVLNVALMAGLLLGHKWAYVAALVFAIVGLIVVLGKNAGHAMGVLIGNGLVIVPLVMSTRFFFPRQPMSLDAEKPEEERA